mmetsp:Transcript_33953/g.72511  ORF Transcript_33953/g.72511 Transcript_33953/m.72511 type:complete len:312 (-) Transcript_33953:636-1571(-)
MRSSRERSQSTLQKQRLGDPPDASDSSGAKLVWYTSRLSPSNSCASSSLIPTHAYSSGVKTAVGTWEQTKRSAEPPKRRRARSTPARMATGVNSGLPCASAAASPMQKTCAAEVASSCVATLPSERILTPAASKLSAPVSGTRPAATRTVSNSSSPSSSSARALPALMSGVTSSARQRTRTRPLCSEVVASTGKQNCLMRAPSSSMDASTRSEHSRSKPRSGIERMSSVTSQPSEVRKPAHSSATYEPPTTSVLPGCECSEKRSSELMQWSTAPRNESGNFGRPPTASTTRFARTTRTRPLRSRSATLSWP